jgi:hypothetical protein
MSFGNTVTWKDVEVGQFLAEMEREGLARELR